MLLINYLIVVTLLQTISAIPIPFAITRVHTAVQYVTDTAITNTAYVTEPTVKVIISGDQTITTTLGNEAAATAVAEATFENKDASANAVASSNGGSASANAEASSNGGSASANAVASSNGGSASANAVASSNGGSASANAVASSNDSNSGSESEAASPVIAAQATTPTTSTTTSTPAATPTTSTPAAVPTTTSTPAAVPTTTSTPAAVPTTTSTPAAVPTTTSTPAAAVANAAATTNTPAASTPAAAPTTTTTPAATTPTTTSTPAATTPAAAPTTTTTPVAAVANAATTNTPATSTSTSTTAASTATSASGISPPKYIVYSPYAENGGCKDATTIKSDIDLIYSKGISKLRIYGTDCGNFDTILPYCLSKGMTVNQGVWISSAGIDSIDSSMSDIISYGKASGWSVFDFITVGNEAVNENYCTADELVSKIKSIRTLLNNAGYSGKITTSEPPVSFINNPQLCTSSGIEFVGINPHSYFNTGISAGDSGEYIMSQKSEVESICGLTAFITETGYPSQGNTNGKNVPSAANQKLAIESIIKSTGGDVTILTTYNDFWKSPGPYGVEQYFGTITLFS